MKRWKRFVHVRSVPKRLPAEERTAAAWRQFFDRSVVLDQGRIVYDGASATLRDDTERPVKLIGVGE